MGGKIYVTGGYHQSGSAESVNPVYVYDPQADAWTQLASMSVARRLHASTAVGGKLYVFGGRGAGGERLSTAEVYDPASDSWAQVSSLTSVRNSMVAIAL
jgi:N-acetylneuraminic acid mutarotase